jgi:Xaa-Pro aminopeptidase
MARFPEGTMGSKLDILARLPLWGSGLDYKHGTGTLMHSYVVCGTESLGGHYRRP